MNKLNILKEKMTTDEKMRETEKDDLWYIVFVDS